jgi:hypothetical protein
MPANPKSRFISNAEGIRGDEKAEMIEKAKKTTRARLLILFVFFAL